MSVADVEVRKRPRPVLRPEKLIGAGATTVLVGRPDASLNEARDRCRMAIVNSGLDWPSSRRTTEGSAGIPASGMSPTSASRRSIGVTNP